MVIRYTAEELTAIGHLVTLKNYVEQCVAEQRAKEQEFQEFVRLQQQIKAQHIYQSQLENNLYNNNNCRDHQQHEQQPQQLTESVAEFFRKAEQNFYAKASIDPTKVRRLSEVEAELIGGRHAPC